VRKAATIVVLAIAGVLLPNAVAAAAGRSGTRHRVVRRTGPASPPSIAAGSMPAAPYAVGVTHVTYTDPTRPTEARGDTPASSSRTIPVTIRYPVMGVAGSAEAPDAIADVGTYPLVVFAHGYDVSADTYAAMEDQLAEAGFVVAAPDFPLTSSALPGAPDEDDVSNQAADVSFVITRLLDPTTVPAVLAGAVAASAVGVVGHSDGGVTAAAVAYDSTVADPRIGAAVVLSGAEARYGGSWFTTQSPPLLAIHGTDDEVNPIASSEQLFDDATGSRMLVTVDGGSHLGPFTTDPEEPTVATLVGDFLRVHLDDDAAAYERLPSDANIAGELTLAAVG
jgi:pimeloyl-ACP methyl ester carboxylesterase